MRYVIYGFRNLVVNVTTRMLVALFIITHNYLVLKERWFQIFGDSITIKNWDFSATYSYPHYWLYPQTNTIYHKIFSMANFQSKNVIVNLPKFKFNLLQNFVSVIFPTTFSPTGPIKSIVTSVSSFNLKYCIQFNTTLDN